MHVANFLIIFGAHVMILNIFKMKIFELMKWSCRLVHPIMLTIELRKINKFWACGPISFKYMMSSWCLCWDPHPTTHHSSIGVCLRWVTESGMLTWFVKNLVGLDLNDFISKVVSEIKCRRLIFIIFSHDLQEPSKLTWWSLLTNSWVNPLMQEGIQRQLEYSYLVPLPPLLAHGLCCAQLWRCWEHEFLQNNSNPSLLYEVFYAYGWDYFQIGLLKVHEFNLLNNNSVTRRLQCNLSTCMYIEFGILELSFNLMGFFSRVGPPWFSIWFSIRSEGWNLSTSYFGGFFSH